MISDIRARIARLLAPAVLLVTFGRVQVDPTGAHTSNREDPAAISQRADSGPSGEALGGAPEQEPARGGGDAVAVDDL